MTKKSFKEIKYIVDFASSLVYLKSLVERNRLDDYNIIICDDYQVIGVAKLVWIPSNKSYSIQSINLQDVFIHTLLHVHALLNNVEIEVNKQ